MFDHKISFAAMSVLMLGLSGCGEREIPLGRGLADVTAPEIVNGKTVGKHDKIAASIVALVAEIKGGQALCTGTLLDDQTVLTAAHCVDDSPTKLTIVFSPEVKTATAAMIRTADRVAQNPRWKKQTATGKGDIALVHFDGGLPAGYSPVTLIAKDAKLANGTEILVAGYGVTDGKAGTGSGILRQTMSSIVGTASKTEMVTDEHKSGACFGDSGGPAFVKEGNDLAQWGVASSVNNPACNELSVHTNLQSYEAWIRTTAAKLAKGEAKKPHSK